MPKRKTQFNAANFEEREFDESAALDKLQVLAKAIRSSQLSRDEYACLIKLVAGETLCPEEQRGFREALRKTLAWAFKQIAMEYQVDPTRKIMTSVLSTQIQDYIYGKQMSPRSIGEELREAIKNTSGIARDRSTRIRGLRRAEQAHSYIFLDSQESEEYIFGFIFVCQYLGFDPKRLRMAIKRRVDAQNWEGLEDLVKIS